VLLQREAWIASALFKDRNKIFSLHYCQFGKLLRGEGRTKVTSALLSSLPVHEKGAAVPEILAFLCLFLVFQKVHTNTYIFQTVYMEFMHVFLISFLSVSVLLYQIVMIQFCLLA